VELPLQYLAGDEIMAKLDDCTVYALATWTGGTVWVGQLAPNGDAAILLTGSKDVRVLGVESAKGELSLLDLTAAAITADGKHLVVGDDFGAIWIVELTTGAFVRQLRPRAKNDHDARPVMALSVAQSHVVAVLGSRTTGPDIQLIPL
jgi:hypothetical protein